MSHLKRLDGWELRLDSLLSSRRDTPFKWGEHDCALFAADAVLAITGQDLAHDLRGMGVRQAIRFVHDSGGLAEIACERLGSACPAQEAREGDILLVMSGDRPALAVALGRNAAAGPAPTGLALIHTKDAVCCWRVG